MTYMILILHKFVFGGRLHDTISTKNGKLLKTGFNMKDFENNIVIVSNYKNANL